MTVRARDQHRGTERLETKEADQEAGKCRHMENVVQKPSQVSVL
jgi:hypothetical protein